MYQDSVSDYHKQDLSNITRYATKLSFWLNSDKIAHGNWYPIPSQYPPKHSPRDKVTGVLWCIS